MTSSDSSQFGSQDNIRFGRENRQFIYSLILIFLIPAAIIVNIFWSVQKNQKIIKSELQKKADIAETVFASTIYDSLEDEALLQTKIDEITHSTNEFQTISVLKPFQDGFRVVASSDVNNLGLTYKSLQYTTAWIEDKKITTVTSDKKEAPQQRYLVAIRPLKNAQSEKTALLNMTITLAEIDELSHKTLIEILVMLGITIFFVLLLLFNHFRFFEYAMLFRRLKEVDKMKDDFISMASHELKTPMAAMKGYLGMIFEGVAGKIDQKAKAHLEKVMANIKRLDALVNALLDVSRLEQGRMQFDMQPIDISKIITDIISQIQVQADEKKLKITYQPLPKPTPLIFADADRLTQVFDNVIGNAIKYTFKGEITIYHRIEGDKVKTFIQDTGVGMSKLDMKGLFQKFYRIRNEQTADIPGTGLGLWITKEIIQRMSGEIYADSKVNIGSNFTIVLPIMKESKK